MIARKRPVTLNQRLSKPHCSAGCNSDSIRGCSVQQIRNFYTPGGSGSNLLHHIRPHVYAHSSVRHRRAHTAFPSVTVTATVYPHSITYKVCKLFPTHSIKAYGGVEMFISLFFTSVLNRYKYLDSHTVVNETSMWLGGPQDWSGRFGKHEKQREIIVIGLLHAISPTTQNCMCEERNSMLNSRNVCHHLV
jgi:hypothetical protein